jgi:hypothetical protein
LRFINTSSQNTPIIEKASVIDNNFSYGTGGTFILHHSLGSNMAVNDFQPFDEQMQIGKNIYMTPTRGRSSDETAFHSSILNLLQNRELLLRLADWKMVCRCSSER